MEFCKIDTITSCYHYTFDSNYINNGHTHESAELNILLKGKMNINIGNRLFRANEGDMFLTAPWVFHNNCLVSENPELLVVHMSGDDIDRLVSENWYARHPDESERGLITILVKALDTVLDTLYPDEKPRYMKLGTPILSQNDAVPPDFEIMKRLLEVLISVMISSPCNYVFRGGANQKDAVICTEAVRIMRERITDKLTIDELSSELHVCPSILKRAFSDFMGKGVIQYFTELKIGEAQRLLRQGKSISFVSDHLGFAAQNYFATVFRRVTGLSPKQVRQSHPHGLN